MDRYSEPSRRRLKLLPRPLTRFAPSPTGYLHLGHVANAIHVWGIARALGGQVVLRLEDHDQGRCRAEYAAAILEDLEWLGLEPDLGTPGELQAGASRYRQSDSYAAYEAAVQRLAAGFRVYGCECSRRDIAGDGDVLDQEPRYGGRCRERGLSRQLGRGTRVVLDPGVERFTDILLGEQEQDPSLQCGDLLLRDRLGNWTYQFAVTVDDMEQEVNLVIRGQDLLSSTGRQLRLARMLGRKNAPVFLHHRLIRHPSGAKLSKANRDTGIRELRAAGVRPDAVLGHAAYLTDLMDSPRDLTPPGLAALFDGI